MQEEPSRGQEHLAGKMNTSGGLFGFEGGDGDVQWRPERSRSLGCHIGYSSQYRGYWGAYKIYVVKFSVTL